MSDQESTGTRKKGSFVPTLVGGTGIFVLGYLFGSASHETPPERTTASAGADKLADVSTPQRPKATLLDIKGSGSKTTESFTASGDWDLTYTYDCTGFGDRGNFIVAVRNADGSISENQGINELGKSGSDTEHYHSPGIMFLQVNSTCDWLITVTDR